MSGRRDLRKVAEGGQEISLVIHEERMTCLKSFMKDRRKRNSSLQFVEQQFNAVFDGQVEEVHVCYNTRELDKLVNEYNSTLIKLQDQIDEYIRLDKLRKKIKRQKVSLFWITLHKLDGCHKNLHTKASNEESGRSANNAHSSLNSSMMSVASILRNKSISLLCGLF